MIATLATAGASLIVALGLIGVAATRSFDGGDARRPVAAFPVATSRPVLAPLRPATPTAVPAAIPDAAKVVCLDPGHGGDDLGAVREADGGMPEMRESTINLAMARNLAARLVDRGFEVVLTRETDSRVNPDNADVNGDGKVATGVTSTQLDDLQARINICNEARANLLLSLHINSSDNPLEKGYEVVYTADREFGDENQRLAQLIHDELGRQMAAAGYEATPRGIIDDITLPGDEGDLPHMVLTGPDVPGAVSASLMPGVIAEPLVMANDDDAAFLATHEGRAAIVTAYERAILQFFQEPAT